MTYHLVKTLEQLEQLLAPIVRGDLDLAAFDTETNLVQDGRFTPWGTQTRIAGFSVSYDHPETGPLDLYAPVRHRPYDWRRREDLLAKVDGGAWVRRLKEEEGVGPDGWMPGWDPNLDPAQAFALLARALAAAGVTWAAHEWRFDASMLQAEDVEPPWAGLFDTKLVSVFTDPRPLDRYDEAANAYYHTGHGLKQLGETWLGRAAAEKDLVDLAREVLQCDDFAMLPLRTILAPYGAQDTRLVLGLREHELKRPAYQDERVRELIRKHHLELRLALEMERVGIHVDTVGAEAAALEAEARAADHRRQAEKLAGIVLPLNNGKELADTLYGRLGLPQYRDSRDTRKATLKQVRMKLTRDPGATLAGGLAAEDGIRLLDSIMDYRRADKELGSFYKPLAQFGADGRVHTILRPLEAKTTRYSSSAPNVQNLPKKGEVRRYFKPTPGCDFLLFDFSQQELRVAAHYSNAIPDAFEYRFTWRCTLKRRGDCKGKAPHGDGCIHVGYRSNWSRRPERLALFDGFLVGDRAFDPHRIMMEACHAQGFLDVTRDTAKNGNFALLYGAGYKKLSETLDISEEFAARLFKIFWDVAYPELGRVKVFVDERLRHHGPEMPWSHQEFLRTLHGGRIHLDTGYYGLNYLVQRSCREILLGSILGVDQLIRNRKLPYRIVLPVHDELIIEAPRDSIDQHQVRSIARTMVEAGAACSVPMIVDAKRAEVSWGEKSELPTSWGFNGITDAERPA